MGGPNETEVYCFTLLFASWSHPEGPRVAWCVRPISGHRESLNWDVLVGSAGPLFAGQPFVPDSTRLVGEGP